MTEISAHTHHALDYVELGVTDFAAAKAFYGGAFGWTFTDYGPGPAYVGIRGVGIAEDVEAGGFRLDDEVTTGGPLVLLYSLPLDSSAQAVRDAGGEVTQEPYDFPGGKRFQLQGPQRQRAWSLVDTLNEGRLASPRRLPIPYRNTTCTIRSTSCTI